MSSSLMEASFSNEAIPVQLTRILKNVLLIGVILIAQPSLTGAQNKAAQPAESTPPFSFGNPQRFFDELFGKAPPADKQALAKIKISPQEERQTGNQAVQSYLAELKRQKIKVVSRGKDVDYLQRLVKTIQPSMRNHERYKNIKVYVAVSPRTDARSFPGGTLVFFQGMLDYAETEAALIGVIGHELSHLDHGHQLNHLRRLKLAQQSLSNTNGAFDWRRMMSNGMMLMQMFSRPFHPEDESEADRDGATWAYRAGYDPNEMAALFLRFHKRDKDKPMVASSFMRTHPFHIDRYKAINKISSELQRTEPREKLYLGKSNLRQRLTRAQREFHD